MPSVRKEVYLGRFFQKLAHANGELLYYAGESSRECPHTQYARREHACHLKKYCIFVNQLRLIRSNKIEVFGGARRGSPTTEGADKSIILRTMAETSSSSSPAGATCQLEIKTLEGAKILLENIPLDWTIEDLYGRVHNKMEASSSSSSRTPEGKWKLAIVVSQSLRTLKWSERERPLRDFGVQPDAQYRVEVILDMGACHGGMCRRGGGS